MNILIDGQTLHTAEISRGIGTYFKEMVESIIRNDFVNIFYITIDDESRLDHLSSYARDKLIYLVDTQFNPEILLGLDRESSPMEYSKLIDLICTEKAIAVYWNPNPQMINTILPSKNTNTKYVATMYDLIPYVMKDVYFSLWPEFIKNEYLSKMEILKNYDHLFPISSNTKKDTVERMSVLEEKQTVAFLGVSKKFQPSPFPIVPIEDDYILYIGGFDPRKNMFRAIEAFSLFKKKYNDKGIDYKLYLVCSLNDESHGKLISFAEEQNIAESLVLTGFVDEGELLEIYQKARCFFFPSLYEGFGLPILEALASGLPVACADNSSLPEVAGKYAEYFDAYDIEDMAKSLNKALNKGTNLDERMRRYRYASSLSWDIPARKLLKGILKFGRRKNSKKKKKIAWVSPLPPQRSGIANYSKVLLLAMKKKADIVIYYDEIPPEKELQDIFTIKPLKKLAKKFDDYDEVIYHLGNNSDFHTNIYKYAWNYPSTVVMHDWNIHPFMQHSFLNTEDSLYYKDAISIYGEDGIHELEEIKKRGYPDVWRFPMSDAIAHRSKRVIVHHQWVKSQYTNNTHIEVIPHFSHIDRESTAEEIRAFKNRYDISDNEFLIVAFGDVNKNKLPDAKISAVKALIDHGYPVKFIFAGKMAPDIKPIFELLRGTSYEKRIFVTGYLDEDEYFSCMYASDLIINLRNPSMGEASGTLMQSLFAQKATIIGNLNQYREFPDDVVAGKIDYDGSEVEQLVILMKRFLENEIQREKISQNAKKYADTVLDLDTVISLMLKRS